MIGRIQALNYRCLQSIDQDLSPFQVLVGPNASGKSTYMDVISFLGDLVSAGPEEAVRKRTENFHDLVWGRKGNDFEMALESNIPEKLRQKIASVEYSKVRYEVAMGLEKETGEISILNEKVVLIKGKKENDPINDNFVQRKLFPQERPVPDTLISKRVQGTRTVINKVPGGNDNFHSEVHEKGGKGGWKPSFKLGPGKSALGNMPADESDFPVSTWLRELLLEGVQQFVLNSQLMRKASPPGQSRRFKPDGSNLPWVVQNLKESSPERFQDWLDHLQTSLPELIGVRTVSRPDDLHRYLVLQYTGNLEVPSWMASDGTLRLLALTIPAYMSDFDGVYLIEEPENGIHPKAVETVYDSLSSVYDAQILIATHSPVILGLAKPDQILCFSKTASGWVDIIRGTDHPNLRDWKGEIDLGSLFAGGVLG